MPSVFVMRPVAVPPTPAFYVTAWNSLCLFGSDGTLIASAPNGRTLTAYDPTWQYAYDGSNLYGTDGPTLHRHDPSTCALIDSSTVLYDGTDPALGGRSDFGYGLVGSTTGRLFSNDYNTDLDIVELAGYSVIGIHNNTTAATTGGQNYRMGSNGTTIVQQTSPPGVTLYDVATGTETAVTLATPTGGFGSLLAVVPIAATGELWASWSDSTISTLCLVRHAADGTILGQWTTTDANSQIQANLYPSGTWAIDAQANGDLLFLTNRQGSTFNTNGNDAMVGRITTAGVLSFVVPSITQVLGGWNGAEYEGSLVCIR